MWESCRYADWRRTCGAEPVSGVCARGAAGRRNSFELAIAKKGEGAQDEPDRSQSGIMDGASV